MLTDKRETFIRVLLRKGVNLQAGQTLVLDAAVQAHELVEFAVSEAFHMGARDVIVLWRSAETERLCLRYGSGGDEYEKDILGRAERAARSGGAYLRLDSPCYEAADGLTPEELERADRNARAVGMLFRRNPDCVTSLACVPTASWAAKVFPGQTPDRALTLLWQAVLRCCRVDEADPLAAWDDYLRKTARRKEKLNARGYTEYHYTSAATDLYLKPARGERWNGGCMENARGVSFIPNIPTEEIFCCPDRDSARGYVSSTLPLYVRGRRVEDFRLTFSDGRVTDFQAGYGRDVLERILAADEGSSRLGEFALVAGDSPIARTGLVYHTTLYDENASCHLALGMGGQPSLPESERRRMGMNTSGLHIDFMIGSEDMRVQGRTADGDWEDIFTDGGWSPAYRFSRADGR